METTLMLSNLAMTIDHFHDKGYDLRTGDRFSASGSHLRRGRGAGNRVFRQIRRVLTGVATANEFSGLRVF